MKKFNNFYFISAFFIFILACSYSTRYTFIGNKKYSPFELIGYDRNYNYNDSISKVYIVTIESDSVKLLKHNFIYSATVISDAVLVYNSIEYPAEITKYENYRGLLTFNNLPFDYRLREHKHTIELTLIAKDSTKHIFKYQSK